MPRPINLKNPKIPLQLVVEEYTIELRKRYDKAHNLLRLGRLNAKLRKALIDAGVDPLFVEHVREIDEEKLVLYKTLVNNYWVAYNDHIYHIFRVDTTALFRGH